MKKIVLIARNLKFIKRNLDENVIGIVINNDSVELRKIIRDNQNLKFIFIWDPNEAENLQLEFESQIAIYTGIDGYTEMMSKISREYDSLEFKRS